MKSGLEHLPETKRRELARVVEILFSEFEAAIAGGKSEHKRHGQILKVILFGSYGRGDWIDDPVSGYVSDYDLLVVVNDEKLTDVLEYWAGADEHLLREYQVTHKLTAPANFIVHCVLQRHKEGRGSNSEQRREAA
jgi:predicted nucleotidyltransferase